MNGFKTLIYEKKGAIASVTLNRPEALNVYVQTAPLGDLCRYLAQKSDGKGVKEGIARTVWTILINMQTVMEVASSLANQVGKRYVCKKCGAEFIVTRGGKGELYCCGKPMELKK